MRYRIIALSVIFITRFLYGQPLSYRVTDSLSSRFYLLGDKKSMSALISQAEKSDRAHFGLYYRYGMLLFEKGEFGPAAFTFRKALQFNPYDPAVYSYLFTCYIKSENYEHAAYVLRNAPKSLKEKYHIKKFNPIHSFEVVPGWFFAPDQNLNYINTSEVMTTLNEWYDKPVYNLQNASKEMSMLQFSFNSQLGWRFSSIAACSYYLLNKELSYKLGGRVYSRYFQLTQTDFAYVGKYVLNSRWLLKAGIHWTILNTQTFNLTIQYPQLIPIISDKPTTVTNILISPSIRYLTRRGFAEAAFSWGDIGGQKVLQTDYFQLLTLSRKAKFLFMPKISYLVLPNRNNVILNANIGYRTGKFYTIWLSLHAGRLMNYQEWNGLILYNLADDILMKTSLNQYFRINRKLSVGLFLTHFKRENIFYHFYHDRIKESFLQYYQWFCSSGIRWTL